MAGTIKIRFQTQALDSPPYTRGIVTIRFNDGTQTLDLREILTQSAPPAYHFLEVAWIDGSSGEDAQQATNFATSFNRDYATVGGIQQGPLFGKNLTATANGNEVTITADRGTFDTGSNYSGNVLIVNIDPPDNNPEDPTPVLVASEAGTGDCSVINYNVAATAGTAPYDLYINGVLQIPGWNGLSTTVALARGVVSKLIIIDDNALQSEDVKVNVPRRLNANNFSDEQFPIIGAADVTINWDTPVAGVTPLEYSLDPTSATTGGAYQTSNVFPAVLEGPWKLFVKDKYGCEVSRILTVTGYTDPTAPENSVEYFLISDFNSLAFSRRNADRKNYDTALSFEDNVGVPKTGFFEFTESDQIQTQFKSSYPFHQVTLFKCDGSKEDLNFLLIQENIGTKEKVDCEIFPVDSTTTGVYFTAGDQYEPDTTNVIGGSPYDSGLPAWAEIGQFVTLGTLGSKAITSISYDADLNVLYFTVDGVTGAAQTDQVQVIFNRHPYNVFRCDFPMTKVTGRAFMRIEPGYDSDNIITKYVHQSEPLRRITDTSKHLKIQWSGFKNLGDMLFVDGYQGIMWVKGRIRPIPIGSAETFDGTDEVYSLEQSQRIGQALFIPLMTPKQWVKFGLVSGISQGGTLIIEDMELVRTQTIEAEELSDSNWSNVSCEFGYAEEGLNVVKGEVVLSPSTGTEGGGGTGKEPVIGWQGFKRLKLEDDTYLRLESGWFVALD